MRQAPAGDPLTGMSGWPLPAHCESYLAARLPNALLPCSRRAPGLMDELDYLDPWTKSRSDVDVVGGREASGWSKRHVGRLQGDLKVRVLKVGGASDSAGPTSTA